MNTSLINSIHIFKRISIMLLLSFLMIGCAFVPEVIDDNTDGCQLITKQLRLTMVVVDDISSSSLSNIDNCFECLLAIIIAVPVASLIVSGSVIVVGNTIHWLEKQGTCKNSLIQTVVKNFVDSMKTIGGKTIQSTTDLMTWIQQAPTSYSLTEKKQAHFYFLEKSSHIMPLVQD